MMRKNRKEQQTVHTASNCTFGSGFEATNLVKWAWRRSGFNTPSRGWPFLFQVIVGCGFPVAEHLMWMSDPISANWLFTGSSCQLGGSGTHNIWIRIKTTSYLEQYCPPVFGSDISSHFYIVLMILGDQ